MYMYIYIYISIYIVIICKHIYIYIDIFNTLILNQKTDAHRKTKLQPPKTKMLVLCKNNQRSVQTHLDNSR